MLFTINFKIVFNNLFKYIFILTFYLYKTIFFLDENLIEA